MPNHKQANQNKNHTGIIVAIVSVISIIVIVIAVMFFLNLSDIMNKRQAILEHEEQIATIADENSSADTADDNATDEVSTSANENNDVTTETSVTTVEEIPEPESVVPPEEPQGNVTAPIGSDLGVRICPHCGCQGKPADPYCMYCGSQY